MANILGLALKVSGDASGLAKSLTPVDRALDNLGKQAEKATAVFQPFADKTAAAGKAQEEFAAKFETLADQLRENVIAPQEYAAAFSQLTQEAKDSAAAFDEGLRVTEQFRTAQEKLAIELERIDALLNQNAISAETANRARAAAVANAEKNNGDLQQSLDGLDESLNVVESRASSVASIFGSVGDSFNSVSGIAEGIGNAVRSVSEAGSAVIQFGADIAKATIAFKAFRLITETYSVPSGLLGVVLNLGKFLTVIKVAEVAAKQFGIDISGIADATTKASLVFAGFKIGGLLGLDKAIAPLVATLGTALPAALARVGVPLAATSAAGAAFSAGLTRLLAFSIPGFGQLAATTYTVVKAFIASRDTLNQLSQSVAATNEEASRLGVTFQDLQVQMLLDTGKTREEIARFGLTLSAIDVRQLDDLALANERASKSSENVQSALSALGATIAKVFSGALAGVTDGVAGLVGGFADLVSGINAIADPIAAVIRPFFTLIGAGVQSVLELGSVFLSATGAVLRFAGTLLKIGLSPIIVGFNNFADTVRQGVGAGFDFISSQIDLFQSQITRLQEFLSRIPVIGAAFASAQGNVVSKVSAQVANAASSVEALSASVSQLSAEEQKEAETRIALIQRFSDGVSNAINESAKFGQAGFDAALKYQLALDDLKSKLDAGLFNEETFRREAEKAGEAFKAELNRIEEDARLDIQISEETQKTLDELQQKINRVADESTKFGQAGFDAAAQFQQKLRDLGQQFEDGRINATTLADETAKATAEYDKQIEGFKKIEELQQSIVKADQDRVNALLAQNNTTTELEKNQAAVQREQLRLEEEIRKQREAGNAIAADAAASRLAQLDQESTKLADLKQAADQGFGDGFGKAFEATSKSIEDIIDKTKSFGVAGQIAASDLRAGIEAAQAKARDGFLGKEAYDKEVARQQEIFEQRAAGAQRVEEFLRGQLDERQRAELDFAAQVEERKRQAALNIQALQDRINAEEQAVQEARDAGNLKAAKDGTARLRQLRQAERIERNIADGRINFQQQAAGGNQQFGAAIAQQQRAAQTQQRMLASANDAIAATARAGAELARRAELARPVQGPVATADIRTAEGAKLVLGLGAQAQDPQLIEARLQTKQLQGIRTAITNATANYMNTPAEIF
jgi:hypothetical protein